MIPLRATCPTCSRKLPRIDALSVATIEVLRTCRGCGERWRILVQPKPTTAPGVHAIHVLHLRNVSTLREVIQ